MNSPTKSSNRILDSVLEFIAHAPSSEFQAFLRDTGQDANELSETSKAGIAAALKAHGERKRVAAKAQHADSVAALVNSGVTLPSTLAEKLELFANLLQTKSATGMFPSLQHRNLTDVPEEELDRLLIRLIQLSQTTK